MSVVEPLTSGDPVSIGPYRLEGVLGAGGMGVVYLGRAADGAAAAVKVIHTRLATEGAFRARFAREIQVARAVRGRWVAALLDGDAYASQPWLATEYVPAPTLEDVIADGGPLPERSVQVLALQLAGALAQLHALGVVHRDLKPSNVLMAEDGPRLIDFGVATAVEATALTQTGAVVGTPAFMSPEQAAGTAIGPPSDVFSLASLLVFAATGRHPFGQTDVPLAMMRRISDDAPDLAAMPDRLRRAIEPCFDKDQAARPSAVDLIPRLVGLTAAPHGWALLREGDPDAIGPYRLLGRLGAGGMGQVYLGHVDLADHANPRGVGVPDAGGPGAGSGGRLVAVKVIHDQYAKDPQLRERFTREVAVARAGHGERVAVLLDADPGAATPWLATEYVPGPSLQTAIDTLGPMPVSLAIRLGIGLAEALQVLHERGIVHRDLKPSNVLLAEDGPKLIDFGIARAFDDTALTHAGDVLGAPGFLSPEQAAGELVGPATDLFALGAVLVFATTGRGPFGTAGSALTLLRRVIDDQPDLTGVPPALVDVAASCLDKAPSRRPDTAAVLLRLRALTTSDAPVSGRAAAPTLLSEAAAPGGLSGSPRARRRVKRRTLLIGGTVGVAALGTAGVLLANRAPTRPVRWSITLPGQGRDVLMALSQELLVMGPGDYVRSVATFNGFIYWSRKLEKGMSSSSRVDANSRACYIDDQSQIVALDLKSGKTLWSNPAARLLSASEARIVCVYSESSAGSSRSPTFIAALAPDTGAIQWKLPIEDNERVGDMLYTSRYLHVETSSRLLTLNSATGEVLWQHARPPRFIWAASEGGLVMITDDTIVRLDQHAGSIAWLKALPVDPLGRRVSPRLACDVQTLHLCDSSNQWCWRLGSGEELWRAGQSQNSRGMELWRNSNTPILYGKDLIAVVEEATDQVDGPVRQRLSVRSLAGGRTMWEGSLPDTGTTRPNAVRLIADGSYNNIYVASITAWADDGANPAGQESATLCAFRLTS